MFCCKGETAWQPVTRRVRKPVPRCVGFGEGSMTYESQAFWAEIRTLAYVTHEGIYETGI